MRVEGSERGGLLVFLFSTRADGVVCVSVAILVWTFFRGESSCGCGDTGTHSFVAPVDAAFQKHQQNLNKMLFIPDIVQICCIYFISRRKKSNNLDRDEAVSLSLSRARC